MPVVLPTITVTLQKIAPYICPKHKHRVPEHWLAMVVSSPDPRFMGWRVEDGTREGARQIAVSAMTRVGWAEQQITFIDI